MAKKRESQSKHAELFADLGPEELREALRYIQSRLTDGPAQPAGVLQLTNPGKVAVKLEEAGAAARTLHPGDTALLEPARVRADGPAEAGRAARGLLDERTRTVIALRLEASGSAGRVVLDLAGLTAHAAAIGSPEALVRTPKTKGSPEGWRRVAARSLEVVIPAGEQVDVIVLGRGPDLDVGTLAAELFGRAAETSTKVGNAAETATTKGKQ